MAAPIYADQADYDEWSGLSSPIALTLFRNASSIVDEALFGAAYTVDPATQLPTDPDVAEAIRDATCAQVQWMDATGDITGAGDVAVVDSASIGTVSFSGRRTTATPTPLPSGRSICPGALANLRTVGLLPITVTTRG